MNGHNLIGGYDKSKLMEITAAMEAEVNDKRKAEGKAPFAVSADRKTFVLKNNAEAGYVAATRTEKDENGKEVQVPAKKWVIVKGSIKPGEKLNRTGKGSRTAAAKPITLDQAERAFNRYYKARQYSSPGRRAAAMSYDMRHSPKDESKVVTDNRYLRNPRVFDYKGFDDGPLKSSAPGRDVAEMRALGQSRRGQKVLRYKNKESRRAVKKPSETEAQYKARLADNAAKASAAYKASQANEVAHRARLDEQNEKAKERRASLKQIEADKEKRRLARLQALRAKKGQAGGSPSSSSSDSSSSSHSSHSSSSSDSSSSSQSSNSSSNSSNGGRQQKQQKQQKQQQRQDGGRAVSLKTAVRLLRSYYNNKYNQ